MRLFPTALTDNLQTLIVIVSKVEKVKVNPFAVSLLDVLCDKYFIDVIFHSFYRIDKSRKFMMFEVV